MNYRGLEYKWHLVDTYLDFAFSSNHFRKKHKNLTFREFKNFKQSGYSLNSMKKMGYSVSLLGFMNKFSKGLINITKKQFEEEYLKNDLGYICKKYGFMRDEASFLRQMFSIPLKDTGYFQRLRKPPLSTTEKSIIYGSMLGDATRHGRSVRFKHGDCQKEYIFWKYNQLQNIVKSPPVKHLNFSEKYNLNNYYWDFSTEVHNELEKCIELFYCSGRKEVTREILEELSPLSIAVWYMDDGATNWKSPTNFEMFFCTNSFSKDSCGIIVKYFEERWGIKCRLRKVNKKATQWLTLINRYSRDKFINLIRPYIIDSMKYKIERDYNK
ncbi:MAG: hypothetical protein ACOC56_04760 [Atribacterota bacterium]